MLEAERLIKNYDRLTAVDGVSLRVEPGEVVGLLGPNGAGKTTTLRMLAGILTPTSGTVRINGLELSAAPLEAKRSIGFLSGDTQLYQRLSLREVLTYFGRLYGIDEDRLRSRVDELIATLEMGSFADRPCGTLSSGQRQRGNIARAFLHQPAVLILDEPTAALDVVSGQFIIDSIRREKARGTAVLFSTHIMSEAEYLCDRILLLHEGRLLDEGTLAELLERSGCDNLTDAFLERSGHRRAEVG